MALFNIFRRNIGTEEIKQLVKMAEGGFNGVIKKIKIIKAGDGACLAELKVEEEHANALGELHGGLSATLVDSITSCALYTHGEALMVPSVSVDLHMSYLRKAIVGDEIVIDADTIKAGKTLAYLKCEIRNKATGNILVIGRHTMFIIRS